MGNRGLSAHEVCGILLLIAGGMLSFAAVDENRDPHQKTLIMAARIACAACFALGLALLVWANLLSRRKDIHPDILAQLLGEKNVFEMDSLHFFSFGRQRQGTARVVVLLQNVYAQECHGRLQLEPVGTTNKIPNAKAPLEFALGPAEVLAVWRDLPVPVTGELSFGFDGFIRKIRSPRVRFKRRTAIRSEAASTGLTAVSLLAGHIHVSGGSRLNIKLESPPADALETIPPTDWQTVSLWSLEDPRDLDQVRQLVQQLSA